MLTNAKYFVRAKNRQGDWIVGNLIQYDDICYILTKNELDRSFYDDDKFDGNFEEIRKDTICSATGRLTCDKISFPETWEDEWEWEWEHDIFRVAEKLYELIYNEEKLQWLAKDLSNNTYIPLNEIDYNKMEKLGNIFDNPELLQN